MAEKLFLQWNDFQDNGKTAFGNVVQLGKGKDCAKICKVCGKEGQATAITNHMKLTIWTECQFLATYVRKY